MKFEVVKEFVDADLGKGIVGQTIEAEEESVKHLLDAGFVKPEGKKEPKKEDSKKEEPKEKKGK